MASLKLNEIRSIFKRGIFNKGEHARKGDWGSFAVRCFYNGFENLIEIPKYYKKRDVSKINPNLLLNIIFTRTFKY